MPITNAVLTRLSLAICAAVVICGQASGATLAFWGFNSPTPDVDPTTGTVQPATGSGTASLVGGVTASFTASNGSSDPNPTDNSNWRITTWPAQSTQNKQNGVRFNVSTTGYQIITLSWDLRNSNTASKYTRLQYTTNGADFIDFQVITMPYETWVNDQTSSFAGVPGVANNPSFGIRFVTEFESTALGSGTAGYVPCNPTNTYGSAGTLRFDMVIVSGQNPVTNLSVLSYNVLGRGVADWTTNSAQVQAIGRQLAHLQPDIIGFQEIPELNANYLQMTNFVATYLPGYYLATGSSTDGGERSVVASRFPITRSKSWLVNSSLNSFGYSGTFTRDLFEAQIEVPGFLQPFHFFTTHLKAQEDKDSATRRGAEARAITNFFANGFLTTNSLHPYCLVGDMNEDIYRPRTYELQAIQTLTSSPTGLQLTTPRNPSTSDDRTWSTRNASLSIRFDYILPSTMLFTNVRDSQVFRSDTVTPTVPPLQSSDSATSSDHLPVVLTVRNPYMAKFDQTISFAPLTNRTYVDSPFDVSATASSGLPVSFSIQYGPATISGHTVTITGIGTVSVRATQGGDFDYNAAPIVYQPFTVSKANQTITFGALTNKTYGDSSFEVSASASSGLPVSFNIQSGPATISGNTVTITGAGTVTVRAAQGGNTYYNAAMFVSRSFTVAKASQTIAFGLLAERTYGDSPFVVNASASSGLPASFSIQSGPATISSNTVTITGAGTVTVRAAQGGNTNYNAATPVDQSFTVSKASSSTEVTSSPNPSCYGSSATLIATVTGFSPTGNVQFFDGTDSLGTASLSGGQASLPISSLSPGAHESLTAHYAGDTNHYGSTSASYTHEVTNVPVTLTITNSGGGQTTISLAGIPGYDYVIQRSSNLVDWLSLVTNTAPVSGPDIGRIQYMETPPHNPAFYRSRQP
jgi:endonuclease/exonuclease/phosphatase family metal-dependent hydrolase